MKERDESGTATIDRRGINAYRALRDLAGETVRVWGAPDGLAQFLALAGPAPTVWFGEIGRAGFAPTAALIGGQVVAG